MSTVAKVNFTSCSEMCSCFYKSTNNVNFSSFRLVKSMAKFIIEMTELKEKMDEVDITRPWC